jgi:predicted RNA-binding Zn ribbon-like protein
MSRDPIRAATQFFGGRVCLDFANTIDWRTSEEPQELLPDYAALLSWSKTRGILPARAVKQLQAHAATRAAAAAAAMREAHALRSDILVTVEALSRGSSAPLATINRWLTAPPAQPRLVRNGAAYAHDVPGAALEEPLWPVLWSLAALLTSDDAARVGCCRAHGCGWYFVDESPNGSRVWCSNDACGNRVRAQRAYAKRRSKALVSGAPHPGAAAKRR